MGVLVVVDLCCDGCKTRLVAPVDAHRDAGTIRTAAEAAGWQVVGVQGARTDRCPPCRPQRRAAG